MNEEQWRKSTDSVCGKRAGGRDVVSRLPPFWIFHGGKTQRSVINHQFILTRMIFVASFVCSYLMMNSFAYCSAVELGSQNSAITSQFRRLRNSLSSPILINSQNVLNRVTRNAPLAESSSGETRPSQSRQISTSEWIFSSLVQPPEHSQASSNQQKPRSHIRRENSGLTYRSLPMVPYTNYYRNPNIYVQIQRKVDVDEKKLQNKDAFGGPALSSSMVSTDNAAEQNSFHAAEVPSDGLNRRRQSSLSLMTELQGVSSVTLSSSKLPEVLSEQETGTTGLSRTAPATDPSLLATERATSTQEMQISNDESSTAAEDDIQLGSRAEIGRGAKKRGRDMNDAAVTFHFENNAPIVFPGTSPATAFNSRGTLRPYAAPLQTETDERAEMASFDPFQAKVLDGWKRLHELRKKSQSFEGRKSSISSDQLADAKIISMLTISGIPKCADKDGFCEQIESYPRAFFNQILNKTLSPDIFKGIFGETTDNNSVVTDVEFKLRHDFEETPLCSVREHTIYPKAAQNRKGKFMYIVNHDEYLQGIRVETCTRENDACMFTEGHLPGYSSTCKQKFIYKKLLAFTPEGKAMPDTFRLPSCCVCHVRSMFISDRINPGTDLGADISPTVTADDSSWNPSSTTLTYPHRDDTDLLPSSTSPTPFSTSTEPGVVKITFPTTFRSDIAHQVPTPTPSTTTSRSHFSSNQQTGGQLQNSRADNQTASRRLH